jgi:hypothetical protein
MDIFFNNDKKDDMRYDIKQYVSLCKNCNYDTISNILKDMKGGYNRDEILYFYEIDNSIYDSLDGMITLFGDKIENETENIYNKYHQIKQNGGKRGKKNKSINTEDNIDNLINTIYDNQKDIYNMQHGGYVDAQFVPVFQQPIQPIQQPIQPIQQPIQQPYQPIQEPIQQPYQPIQEPIQELSNNDTNDSSSSSPLIGKILDTFIEPSDEDNSPSLKTLFTL